MTGPDTRCRAWDDQPEDEPTFRDRLIAGLTDADMTRPAFVVADALIEAEVVADPEFVAWLAGKVTQVKSAAGRMEAAEAEVERLRKAHQKSVRMGKQMDDLYLAETKRAERAEAAVAAGLALADDLEVAADHVLDDEWVDLTRSHAESIRDALALSGVTDPKREYEVRPDIDAMERGEAPTLRTVTDPRADAEARIREQIAADIEDLRVQAVGPPDRMGVWLIAVAEAARIARGDHEATTHTTDNEGDDRG